MVTSIDSVIASIIGWTAEAIVITIISTTAVSESISALTREAIESMTGSTPEASGSTAGWTL
jgi:hypothetical protein